MEVLKAENIHFSYTGHPVLTGLNHGFEAGTFTAVLGTNGSGKTTFLKLLTKALKPASGEILLHGEYLRNMASMAIARKIAYVQQVQHQVFAATVFDTVMAGRNPYMGWMPSATDRLITAEILETTGLENFALRNMHTLSGGQRQKVYLARALAQQTDIVLLDEPTANLDPRHQSETLDWLSGLGITGKTIVMALHDINLAVKYCSHFLLLHEGKALASGPIDSLQETMLETVFEIPVKKVTAEGRVYFLYT